MHVIGSTDFVDAVLPKILAVRPGVVFLPWEAFTEQRANAIRTAGGSAWIAVWREWDGLGEPQWPTEPDGVLVMLIQPGTTDRCRLDRIGLVTACTTIFSELPVAVDGGVTEDVAPLCAAAGVRQMVVGRALLKSRTKGNDMTAISPTPTTMRASVMTDVGTLEIEDRPVPTPGPTRSSSRSPRSASADRTCTTTGTAGSATSSSRSR